MYKLKNLLYLTGGTNNKTFDIVVYHADCRDGICSMWCYYHYSKNDKFIKIGLNASKDPKIEDYDFKDKSILFVDICPSIEFIKILAKIANTIVIIDHHDTNQRKMKDLDNIDNLETIFDMKLSACMLTWNYFFPNTMMPWFIEHVGARDIWQEFKDNLEIIKAMEFYELITADNLDNITKLLKYKRKDKKKLIETGSMVIKIMERTMKDESKKAIEGLMTVGSNKYNVIVGTITSGMVSDYGNYLALKNLSNNSRPDFAIIWFYDPKNNSFYISLRGHDTSPNLAMIAENFGGGGHPKASGFRLNNNMMLKDIISFSN